LLAACICVALLAACTSLPPAPPRAPETALPASPDSPLVKIARRSTPEGGDSGMRLMPLGVYSLDARLQLIDRATHSLDLQYYVLDNDATGRLVLSKLHDAALRGVRVRLLLDDLYTGRTDEMLRALATTPNIEIRLYNPFCCARNGSAVNRIAASLFDFKRINHRMHNKLFIADGVMAVLGGRNIADAYFLLDPLQNFVDIDAFVIGAAVDDMTTIFDRYWNSEVVYPLAAVGEALPPPAEGQARFDMLVQQEPRAEPLELPPVDALGYGPIGEDLDGGRIGLVWGKARVFADPPDKPLEPTRTDAYSMSVTRDVMERIWEAQRELVVTSPYLIPGKSGLGTIESLRSRGVKITVMTNSLAATDEPLVHNGYSRYRMEMLRQGVDLYELSPRRAQHTLRLGMFGTSLGRLHAKTAIIDAQTVFIGSMNLDPRSSSVNTEFGMFIESQAIAKEMLRIVNISKLQSAYRVRLNPNGPGLQWITSDGDKEIVLRTEPETSLWLRVHNAIFGWFVPEQLL
jgi:putative cardiolipin synthase